MLVFASHFVQYVSLTGTANEWYLSLRSYLGQMVVVPFLFYSGYGVQESIRKKGKSYVERIPGNRISKVLFQFDVAVMLFVIVGLLQGKSYSVNQILFSLIGWDGVGNSNWYIFAVVFLYFITFVSCSAYSDNKFRPLIRVTLLTALFCWIMSMHRDGYWYNTAMVYPAGMWFSEYREQIDRKLSMNRFYFPTLFLLIGAFAFCRRFWAYDAIYELSAVIFGLAVVLLTMKISVQNSFLKYCGKHLFSLYILQRLPMIILKETPVFGQIPLYFILSLLFTFILSYIFDAVVPLVYTKTVAKIVSPK